MTYDFFADNTDKINILEFILNETDLQIFDLGSPYGQVVCEYRNVEDITSKFDLKNDNNATTFQLWSPNFKGNVVFRKVELNPKYCNGHTFRYSTDGLGLIQLYFGGIKNNELYRSHIGHFNEKGALKNASDNSTDDILSNWNWEQIHRTSRKLKYQIHNKLAVKKIESFGVLNGASKLEKQGVKFR